jgi:UDP-N-acetylglucosamine 1-carboxyvinyltransferase
MRFRCSVGMARFGEATVSLPGGCAIGSRPVDIKGYAGHRRADIAGRARLHDCQVAAPDAHRLKGCHITTDEK